MKDLDFQIGRLRKKHDAIHKEVEFLEAQRDTDRSYLALHTLRSLKRQKLQIKDAIAALEAQKQ